MRNLENVEKVFKLIDAVVNMEIADPSYKKLMNLASKEGYKKIYAKSKEFNFFQSVDYPLFVYEALGGLKDQAIPLAAACTLLHMSADMLDDIADGDLPSSWDGIDKNKIILVANDLLAFVAQKCIVLLLDVAPEYQLMSLSMLFSNGVHKMSVGQLHDMDLKLTDPPKVDFIINNVIRRKTGGQHEVFAVAGAILAGASNEKIALISKFSENIGIAGQLINDFQDIWQKEISPDLMTAKATVPILLAYNDLKDKNEFLLLLEELRLDYTGVIQTVKELIQETNSLEKTSVLIEEHKKLSFECLENAVGIDKIEIFKPVYDLFSKFERELKVLSYS
ncbi:polyprenyl synthetase family protein [Priestia megaterium]|uniref:Uncharacterized protein n=1 Tax=Priestia megaterium TaxID=1404 RepID=A0A6M6E331_PRIMG|nr:polyprenyl synthetase family protein [Priestia megaterium]QJX80126.1 hypothetical protein FDZ14_28940 [Priestia megaterium]